jgi:hypothetical protein
MKLSTSAGYERGNKQQYRKITITNELLNISNKNLNQKTDEQSGAS